MFSQSLLDWLKSKANDVEFKNGLELVGLDVSDGEMEINQTTFSRSNKRNIEVVMDLIQHLIANGALNGMSCCILPTYADQKKAYVEAMIALSKNLEIPWEDMVSVSTVDSMQGGQSDIVIVDWVVTSGESMDLGFGADNRRANVALTRARACLIVVANGQIINNDRLDGDETKAKVPPEILVHWKYLLDNDLIVPCPRALPDNVDDTGGTLVYDADDDTADYNADNAAEVDDIDW